MDFNEKDWIERMSRAVGEQEIRDLINELPDGDSSSPSKVVQEPSVTGLPATRT